jgi:hypothetical protein
MGRIAVMAGRIALASVVLAGCDRGVEANQDNLSHFADVASDLRRDARELELLAKKVAHVRLRLETKKNDVAEHVYNDEIRKQRDLLLARMSPALAPTPDPAVEGNVPAPVAADPEAWAGAVALHDQLFDPLQSRENTLDQDNDYAWWLEELGLQGADEHSFVYDSEGTDERDRALADCRTAWTAADRGQACANLINTHLTSTHFQVMKKQRLSQLGGEIERLAIIEQQFSAEAETRKISAEKVMAAYGSSFDGLIIWGFPSLIVAVLVIVLFESRRRKSGDSPLPDTLAVVTVLLLVSAIIILGLGGKIQPEALGTLIGGISGYVLGKGSQVLSTGDKPKDEKASAPPTPPSEEEKVEAEAQRKPEPTKSEPAKLAPAELAEVEPPAAKQA